MAQFRMGLSFDKNRFSKKKFDCDYTGLGLSSRYSTDDRKQSIPVGIQVKAYL